MRGWQFVLILAFICANNPASAECDAAHPDREALVGRWTWIHSFSFLEGEEFTPESEGYTYEWTLKDNGTYERILNDRVVGTGTWCIAECEDAGEAAGYCFGQTVIYMDDGFTQFEYRHCPDPACFSISVSYGSAIQVQALAMDAYLMTFEYARGVSAHVGSWSTLKAHY